MRESGRSAGSRIKIVSVLSSSSSASQLQSLPSSHSPSSVEFSELLDGIGTIVACLNLYIV